MVLFKKSIILEKFPVSYVFGTTKFLCYLINNFINFLWKGKTIALSKTFFVNVTQNDVCGQLIKPKIDTRTHKESDNWSVCCVQLISWCPSFSSFFLYSSKTLLRSKCLTYKQYLDSDPNIIMYFSICKVICKARLLFYSVEILNMHNVGHME